MRSLHGPLCLQDTDRRCIGPGRCSLPMNEQADANAGVRFFLFLAVIGFSWYARRGSILRPFTPDGSNRCAGWRTEQILAPQISSFSP